MKTPIEGLEYAIGARLRDGDEAPSADPKAEAAKITAAIQAEQANIPPTSTSVPPAATSFVTTVAIPGKAVKYMFMGIDVTSLVTNWNSIMKKLGIKSGKKPFGQAYRTSQWDGTISGIEKRRR